MAAAVSFASAAPPAVVTARCFEGLYHEIFHESDPQPVLDALQRWIATRWP